MDNEMITVLIKALVAVLSVVITVYIVPWIKGKIGEDKYAEILSIIKYAVRCAEQYYTPEQNEEKKEFVKSYIIDKATEIGLKMSVEDLDMLIEGIVNEVKKG